MTMKPVKCVDCGEPVDICENCGQMGCVVCNEEWRMDSEGCWLCPECYVELSKCADFYPECKLSSSTKDKQTISGDIKHDTSMFDEAIKPAMQYLAENHHPHCAIIVTSNRAELMEGIMCCATDEFIID